MLRPPVRKPDRCYLCKKELFERIKKIAENEGLAEVVEGSNLDDDGDYRPGLKAIAELGIKRPLRQVGFSKEQIRILSKNWGSPTSPWISLDTGREV